MGVRRRHQQRLRPGRKRRHPPADFWWQRRAVRRPDLIDDALKQAGSAGARSLLDMETTSAAAPRRRHRVGPRTCEASRPDAGMRRLCDPESAESREMRIDARVHLRVGGKTDDHGKPFEADFRVVGLYGNSSESKPRRRVLDLRSGPQPWCTDDSLICSKRMVPFSIQHWRLRARSPISHPRRQGVHAPVATYTGVSFDPR